MLGPAQLILLGMLVAVYSAPSPQEQSVIPIVKQEQDGPNPPDGNYRFSFETGNGIVQEEEGAVQGEALSVRGSSSYSSPDNVPIRLTYTAGVEGYVPQGDHLPTPPPTPEAILKALAYIAANPPPPENAPPGRQF